MSRRLTAGRKVAPRPLPSLEDYGPQAVDLLGEASDLPTAPAYLLEPLEAPAIVISEHYVGPERRSEPRPPVQRLLRLESLVVVAIVLVLATICTPRLLAAARTSSAKLAPSSATTSVAHQHAASPDSKSAASTSPAAAPAAVASTTIPATTTPVTSPPTTTPPATTTPVTSSPPTTPVASAAPATAASVAPVTPDALGAEALALVRYPWQQIPSYHIVFKPIADAPSPDFLGNTDFTWGQTGGTSTLYVFPGETVTQLAGIIGFEIGHEVDASAVEPQGGEAAIENILGIHPSSWAPNCDCAEQNYLSGWYAAAFSNYWSPGVGNWSNLAAEPTGPVLAAVEPWLNPVIP